MVSNRDIKNFNPFPGLRPFAPEESDLFFGRENESMEVLGKLMKNRFITVIGASGSGKSSLIYCGVMPKVRNSGDGSDWRIITFRPGNDPFGNLADSIMNEINTGDHKKIEREKIHAKLKETPEGLAAVLKDIKTTSNEKFLLVIDQFEELFRYGSLKKKEDEQSASGDFVNSVFSSVGQLEVNIFIILTMRSDFIGECAHYQGLTTLINNSNYLVPHMGSENYREAIVGPVKYAGAEIEPGLIDTLLNEIGNRTDQLPVLQHALMRTWTHWQELDEPDRPIGKVDYDSVGTMKDAMSLHVNEAYEELSLKGREICEILFKTITEKGPDNKGLRHPTNASVIMAVSGCTIDELSEVVEKFRIPSRSFITPRQNIPLTEDSVIDLSHESLMRLWDRLREWVDAEAASVQMYLRLSEASAMYQQGKTSLWRPPDLQLAIVWRDQNKPTLTWAERFNPAFERAIVYLRTSEREYVEEEENKIRLQKKQMKRTRIVAMILGIAAIISMGFMLFAFVQKIAADRQTILAEQRKTEAELQRSIADSTAIIATEQRSLAVTNASLAEQRAEEARIEKENAERQKQIAEFNAVLARKNEKLALEQTDSATRAKELALKNARIANMEREAALRLRMLSIGKAMAVKSLQADGQKDLQTLLAYQAYLFNKNNNGNDNDADIYAALYNVARQYGNTNYKVFKGHNGEIKSIAFVPGKNEFYSTGNDGKILKWSLDNKEQSIQIIYSGKDIIEVLAVSPDAAWLACGNANSSIRMIPLNGNSTEYEMKGHTRNIKSLIFSYDGKFLYSASLDGKVLKWDLAARTNTDLSDGSMQITSIDISSSGNYLAGLSRDGSVIVWNPETKSDNFRLETGTKKIKTIRFNPSSNILAIGDVNGNIELWDIRLRKKISEVKAHSAQINDIQFNPTLRQMATASNDKTLKIFNIKDLTDLTEPPISFADNEGFVLLIQFNSDGQMIVSGNYEGSQNLSGRPTHVDYLTKDICGSVTRNMTQDEWNTYIGRDIPIEKTCKDPGYNIKVEPLK
jgi:WD40 repeat protein